MRPTDLPTKSMLLALTLLFATFGQCAGAKELPLDVAFDLRSPALMDRAVVHPRGLSVALGIQSASTRRSDAVPERFLPGGTPANMDGVRLHLARIPDGALTPIGPADGNSWRPAWSPDGERLAFYSDAGGKPELWVHDLPSNTFRRVANVAVRAILFPGDSPLWSPDGGTLYVPARPTRDVPPAAPKPDRVQVYASGAEWTRVKDLASSGTNDFLRSESLAEFVAIQLDTGDVRTVLTADSEPGPASMRLSPSGRWLSCLSVPRRASPTVFEYTFDLSLIPADGGEPQWIARGLPVPDNPFAGSYQWHPTRDLLVFVQDRKLYVVEPGGTPRQIAAAFERVSATPLAFTRDGTSVAVRGRKDSSTPHDFLALVPLDGSEPHVIDLAESPAAEVVTVDRQVLWQPSPDVVAATLPAPDGEDRQAVLFHLHTGERTILNPSVGGLSRIAGNRDQTLLVGIDQRFDAPPDLSVLDESLNAHRLTTIEPRLKDVPAGTVTSFQTKVPLFDGQEREVTTTVLLPEGRKPDERLPTLVSVYGGAEPHSVRWQYAGGPVATFPAQIFTSRGYAVLFPALPITPPGRGGNPAREITDLLLPQVERAIKLGLADDKRLTLIGQSYGGYSAIAVACESPRFQAAVAVNGLYDLAAQYGRMDAHNSDFAFAWSETGQGRMGTHPWGDRERYIANSPYWQADRLRTPLLLLVGSEDEDAAEGRKLFRAATRLEKPVQLAVYPGCGHAVHDWPVRHAADAAKRILDFPARAPPWTGAASDDGLR